jgi:Flp pilus assembly pilin Flp
MLAAITAVITAVVFALGPAVRGTFEQGSCALKSQQPQTTSC